MADETFYGAIEAGGTKIVCAVFSSGPLDSVDIVSQTKIPTTSPSEVFPKIRAFFEEVDKPLSGFGIGTFGPVCLDRDSDDYGTILKTPKPHWEGACWLDTVPELAEEDSPVAVDTDVNAAALGELNWGAGKGVNDLVYITIGTGIGDCLTFAPAASSCRT
ncbi:MAG: ROK family protein [Verrucomicrobiota bacterium]